jgi:hypothetical protein
VNGHAQHPPPNVVRAARRPLLAGLSLLAPLFLLALSYLLAAQSTLGSEELLSNEGFENGTLGWQRFPLDITFVTVTVPVHTGEWAGSLDRDIDSSEIYVYQNVSVAPSQVCTLTGSAYSYQSRFAQVCLRIDWRFSSWPDEEYCLDGDHEAYRPITLALRTAPSDTTSARIMALAKTGTAGPGNAVYFDDLSFTCSSGPTATMPISIYIPLVLKECAGASRPLLLPGD